MGEQLMSHAINKDHLDISQKPCGNTRKHGSIRTTDETMSILFADLKVDSTEVFRLRSRNSVVFHLVLSLVCTKDN